MVSRVPDIDRQGSVFSRLSDYDVLDVIQNEEEPDEVDTKLQQAAAASATGWGCLYYNYLVVMSEIFLVCW